MNEKDEELTRLCSAVVVDDVEEIFVGTADNAECDEQESSESGQTSYRNSLTSSMDDTQILSEAEDGFPEHIYKIKCRIRDYRCPRTCIVTMNLFAIVILTVCIIGLFIYVFLVTIPYTKVLGFISAECRCSDVRYDLQEKQCSCGRGCTSTFPCLQIFVSFSDLSNVTHIGKAASDETYLQKRVSKIFHQYKMYSY